MSKRSAALTHRWFAAPFQGWGHVCDGLRCAYPLLVCSALSGLGMEAYVRWVALCLPIVGLQRPFRAWDGGVCAMGCAALTHRWFVAPFRGWGHVCDGLRCAYPLEFCSALTGLGWRRMCDGLRCAYPSLVCSALSGLGFLRQWLSCRDNIR